MLGKALSKLGDCLDGIFHDMGKLKQETQEKMGDDHEIRTVNKYKRTNA